MSIAIGGTFDEQTGLRVGGDSQTASSSIGVHAYHLVPRLGWLHRINPEWEIGVMLQTPGIPLSQKGDVLRRITTDISPDPSTFFLFDADGASVSRSTKRPCMEEGKIHIDETIVEGLDQAWRSVNMLFTGENIGKLLVRVAED